MPIQTDGATLAESLRQTIDASEQAEGIDACTAEALRRSLIPFAEFVRDFQASADPARIRHAGVALAAGIVGHVVMNVQSGDGPVQDIEKAIKQFQRLLLSSLAAEGLIRVRLDRGGRLN